jgi:hypothetical protein
MIKRGGMIAMATCKYEKPDGTVCGYTVKDGYTLCWTHYSQQKATTPADVSSSVKQQATTSAGGSVWHADPVVDTLLKINHNLSRIVRMMEEKKRVPPEASLFGDSALDEPS